VIGMEDGRIKIGPHRSTRGNRSARIGLGPKGGLPHSRREEGVIGCKKEKAAPSRRDNRSCHGPQRAVAGKGKRETIKPFSGGGGTGERGGGGKGRNNLRKMQRVVEDGNILSIFEVRS